MDKDFGICGRENEIKEVYNFIVSHIDDKKSGILYVTGPPGTGKTMSVNHVINQLDNKLTISRLNCFKAQTMKAILSTICKSANIEKSTNSSEPEMIAQLERKFTGRTCKPHLIVLDEMDQLPKRSKSSPFKTIFSWTKNRLSKLIIIGIANTVNLTARCQAISNYAGEGYSNIEKIIFKPYSSKDIKSILNWYLENDENFEDADVDSKALDMIATKFAREKGDIRSALNALRSAIDDINRDVREEDNRIDNLNQSYPTPPSTPPITPCKERTNLNRSISKRTTISSVANSVKKRQRESHYYQDHAPSCDKIVLVILEEMRSSSNCGSVDKKTFLGKAKDILLKYRTESDDTTIRSALDQLESQGLISFKKGPRSTMRVFIKASDQEISRLVGDHDSILNFVRPFI